MDFKCRVWFATAGNMEFNNFVPDVIFFPLFSFIETFHAKIAAEINLAVERLLKTPLDGQQSNWTRLHLSWQLP